MNLPQICYLRNKRAVLCLLCSPSRSHSDHHLWLLADDLGPQAGCDCHAHSSSGEWQSELVVLTRRHGPLSSIVLMYALYMCRGVWWWGVQFHCVHLKVKDLNTVSYLHPIKGITSFVWYASNSAASTTTVNGICYSFLPSKQLAECNILFSLYFISCDSAHNMPLL